MCKYTQNVLKNIYFSLQIPYKRKDFNASIKESQNICRNMTFKYFFLQLDNSLNYDKNKDSQVAILNLFSLAHLPRPESNESDSHFSKTVSYLCSRLWL